MVRRKENASGAVIGRLVGELGRLAADADEAKTAEPARITTWTFRVLTAAASPVVFGDSVLHLSAGSNDVDAQLPPAAEMYGRTLAFYRTDTTTANRAIITADGSEKIGGEDELALAPGDGALIHSNGATWIIIAARAIVRGALLFSFAGTLAPPVTGANKIPNDFEVDQLITKVRLDIGTVPAVTAVIVDILNNGVTIFTNPANRPQIAVGQDNGASTTIDVPLWEVGDRLTADLVQGDGADLIVTVGYKRNP